MLMRQHVQSMQNKEIETLRAELAQLKLQLQPALEKRTPQSNLQQRHDRPYQISQKTNKNQQWDRSINRRQ
jgi:hypothetical protein